jgi:hypothetical protein
MHTLKITTPRKYKLLKWLFGADRNIIKRKGLEGWQEISRKQLKGIVKLFFFQELTADQRKLKVYMLFYKLSNFRLHLFEPDQMHQLLKKISFIFEEPLNKQLLPKVKVGWHTFYGPGDNLNGYRGEEFQKADTYFMLFNESNNLGYLNKMIAVLYRKKGKHDESGDIRLPYTDYAYKQSLPIISKLPDWQKFAILMYYQGCRQEWESIHPQLFDRSEAPEEGQQSFWHIILLRISNKEFGKYEDTINQPIHNLFTLMNEDIKDHNKAKVHNNGNTD